MQYKSGYIAIIGAPNVGKSTLLNRMTGEKISITSAKPQTTRNRILGIVTEPEAQFIFIDTPGIHKAKSALNIDMVNTAISAMSEVDILLFITDASRADLQSEKLLAGKLERIKKPVILAINKIDLVKKKDLLSIIAGYSKLYPFDSIVPVSAKHGTQVSRLVSEMEKHLPPGPMLFPEDALTDMPERFIAAEIIREKVFRHTGDEIPYSTAVTIESFKEESVVKIHAAIHIERDSQKGIIIGKKGQKLKQIGSEARKEIEKMTGTKVFLKLFVRVQKNWSKDTKALRKFGYCNPYFK